MERLDFCSVMGVMRRYVSEDRGISQIDFLYMLFDDYFQNGDTDNFVLDKRSGKSKPEDYGILYF